MNKVRVEVFYQDNALQSIRIDHYEMEGLVAIENKTIPEWFMPASGRASWKGLKEELESQSRKEGEALNELPAVLRLNVMEAFVADEVFHLIQLSFSSLLTLLPHRRSRTFCHTFGTFRHKQDSTLVAEQTTIFSVYIFLRVNI